MRLQVPGRKPGPTEIPRLEVNSRVRQRASATNRATVQSRREYLRRRFPGPRRVPRAAARRHRNRRLRIARGSLRPHPALAPAAAPSARDVSMRITFPTISVVVRFWPSRLSSHCRVWMRPSTYTSMPFFRYCCAISASFPHKTMRCHSVRFWRSPARSLKVSSVASVKLATACPPDVYLVSGSRPRRPTRMALLTDMRQEYIRKRGVNSNG